MFSEQKTHRTRCSRVPHKEDCMNIGPRVLARTKEMIGVLLDNYHNEIEEAYCNTEDDDGRVKGLGVDVKLKFSPDSGAIGIDATINFVSERVKDTVSDTVDEKQIPLFETIDYTGKEVKFYGREKKPREHNRA